MSISPLQKARAAYAPKLPPALANGALVKVTEGAPTPRSPMSKKSGKFSRPPSAAPC